MTGLVTLLGAGPGDADLLTLKGAKRLKEADVLVFDRLVNPVLFQHIKANCERIDVGKQPGQPCVRQEEIEQILIKKAQEGKRVVRLKSGDPYIFGRGGEEAKALKEAGIAFEIVPGVTSAIAALTYAGIPMTYRDVATSFHIFTGHLKDETESLNWDAISQLKGTLVFMMGMKNLATIAGELVKRGYAKETPVAIVEWGTHPSQRSIDGTLDTIVDLAAQEDFKAPSVIVVGDVVSFRKELNFYENLPLFGKKILIQDSPTGKLPSLLKDDGARLLTFPARNRVEKLDFDLPDLDQVAGILVADMQSWPLFLEKLRAEGRDLRSLLHIKFAGIGLHTSKGIEQAGILLHAKGGQISDPALKESLAQEAGSWYILAPSHKKEELVAHYDFPLLETHSVSFDEEVATDGWEQVEVVCLPNSLAAANFVALSQELKFDWGQKPVVAMGASTREVLEKAGFANIIETDQPTIAAIRDKCREILG